MKEENVTVMLDAKLVDEAKKRGLDIESVISDHLLKLKH